MTQSQVTQELTAPTRRPAILPVITVNALMDNYVEIYLSIFYEQFCS